MPGENPNPAAPAAAPAVAAAVPAAAPAAPVAPAAAAPAGEPAKADAPILAVPEVKPAEVKPETVPDAYTFKAPEGQELDAVQIEAFTPVFKELGLTQDKAQKLIDTSFAVLPKLIEARDSAIQAELVKEDSDKAKLTRADPEYGGAKFDENAKVANAALAKFGRPALAKKLLEAGLSNDPDMVHLLWNVGRKLGESIPPVGGKPNQDTKTAAVLYPSMNS